MINKVSIINKEIEDAEKQMLLDKYNTAMKKAKYISEIKSGLGDEIRANPNRAHIIKKSLFQRFMIKLKILFTKF